MTAGHDYISAISLSITMMTEEPQAISPDIREDHLKSHGSNQPPVAVPVTARRAVRPAGL